MKKLAVFILGALLGTLATYVYYSNYQVVDCEEDNMAIVKPKGLITPDQAKVLDTTYNLRHKLISDSIVTRDGGDNRSSWFSLTDVKNYLKYADSQSTALGYKMDGVRIYMAAYPNDSKLGAGFSTVFFVPTGTESISKGNTSFFNFKRAGSGDIPGGGGLNSGDPGEPPSANYPQ